jgi:hypothetical protein
MAETLLSGSNVLLFGRLVTDLQIVPNAALNYPPPPPNVGNPSHSPFPVARAGGNRDVESQLTAAGANFARIYGFSYEGTYYDLPRPVLYLVHGPGQPVSQARPGAGPGNVNVARAPVQPSQGGVAAADFEFADDVMVWSYDKADYTIRMDVETGMFEDVLLDILGGGGPGVSGARVSGARVSGARVSGARVSGARLSGGSSD